MVGSTQSVPARIARSRAGGATHRAGGPKEHGSRPYDRAVTPRRAAATTVALVAVALASVAAFVLLRDDGDDLPVATGATSASTADGGQATAGTEAIGDDDTVPGAIWAAPTDAADPESAAVGFATEVLGLVAPVAVASRSVDPDHPAGSTSEVTVAPRGIGPTTTITVMSLAQDGPPFVVLMAMSETIEISQPTPGNTVVSPVEVAGTSDTFEGNVIVEIRVQGQPEPLARTFASGGANGMRGPFAVVVEFDSPAARTAMVIAYEPDESGAGTALSASAVAVALA